MKPQLSGQGHAEAGQHIVRRGHNEREIFRLDAGEQLESADDAQLKGLGLDGVHTH